MLSYGFEYLWYIVPNLKETNMVFSSTKQTKRYLGDFAAKFKFKFVKLSHLYHLLF